MVRITVELPKQITDRDQARSVELGYSSLTDYYQARLLDQEPDDFVLTPGIERLLLDRLESSEESIPYTKELMDDILQQFKTRHGLSG